MKKKPKNKAKSKVSASAVGFNPGGDRVLIRPMLPEKVTSSGIIIPETVDKEKPEQGKIVAVGPGKKNDDGKTIPISYKVGERVMFSKYGYDEVKINGTEYYIVSENNILGIFK